MSALVPPRVAPPPKPLGGAAYVRAFLRNPLSAVPQSAYEEDFVPFAWGRTPRAWVTSPAFVKAVLLDERDKFRKRMQIRLLGPLLGSGILTSEGAEWKWQRQAAAPMFRPQELAGFVPAFVRAAEARLAAWRDERGTDPRRIDHEMTAATFEVVRATLLPSGDESLAPTIRRAIASLQKSGGWDLLLAALDLPHWLPRPGIVAEAKAIRTLRAAVADVVRANRDAVEAAAPSLTQRLVAARDPESGQAMSEERLVDNVLTFYLAGHETTAKALTWTLYLLARSPEWSDALGEEIGRVVGEGAVTHEHLDRLVLTQQVLKESMRLYPPVPIMSRQAVADARIDGHEIRAGTSVLMPIYTIHRHRRRWEDPDAFRPERFSPAAEAAIPRYQYMPFGAGPRLCIGMAFAMMEATAMLATLLAHARFAPVDGVEPEPLARVTLLPRGGMPLHVRLR